jgi:transcription antitermination protein NusB
MRKKPMAAENRSAARLAAAQALYQMEVTGKGVKEIIAEFETCWIGQEVEGDQYKPAEIAFFRSIVSGVVENQVAIDRAVDQTLSEGWPLRRIEALMRAILRAGAFELLRRGDIPARVAIKEYVDVAGAFFDRDEAGMINAVLDALARKARAAEFSA